MTRFFSQVILEERDGTLAARAGGGGARGGVRKLALLLAGAGLLAAGCGSQHEARHRPTVSHVRTVSHGAPAPDVRRARRCR